MTVTTVIDENGAPHVLKERIGKGGQGEVWRTANPRRIVKLHPGGRDPEATRRQLTWVRRLDLRGHHVAKPLSVLRPPHVGYVAEFLDEMGPLGDLLHAPVADLVPWHLQTGGLRRRLRLLAHAAEALLALHAKGVIYADVSPNNVFVSLPIAADEAWLIDLDNLSTESDPRRAVVTPGYGAPEVVAGKAGCTSLSDAWAFAVLAWQVLTLQHPFLGDWVSDGDPELEEQAFKGTLPWVLCEDDDRNRCSTGIPADITVGKKLLRLADKMFTVGRQGPLLRPGLGAWVDALHATADQTVACPTCGATYLVTADHCPWCRAAKPEELPCIFRRWDPDEPRPERRLVETATSLGRVPITTEARLISRRLTHASSGVPGRAGSVALRLVHRGVDVVPAEGAQIWVARWKHNQGLAAPPRLVTGTKVTLPRLGWLLFFDDPSKPQRVALLGGA